MERALNPFPLSNAEPTDLKLLQYTKLGEKKMKQNVKLDKQWTDGTVSCEEKSGKSLTLELQRKR